MKRFNAFCTTYHINNSFPLTEHLMCYYASFLADQGLATQTVKGYLSALRNMQISLGLPDPREQSSMPLLKWVQAGIARTRKAKGNSSRVRLPITPHLLHRIRHVLSGSDHPERIVLWAKSVQPSLGFSGWASSSRNHPSPMTAEQAWHGARWQWTISTPPK